MRYLATVIVVAGCHAAPAPAPAAPAAPAETPLHADLVTFCSAEGLKHVGPLSEFGPWYQPLVKSTEMNDELEKLKGGSVSIHEWSELLGKQIADAGIGECATYAALFAVNHDHPRPED